MSLQKSYKGLGYLFSSFVATGCILMAGGAVFLWRDFGSVYVINQPAREEPVNTIVAPPTEKIFIPSPSPTDTLTPTVIPYTIQINTKDNAEMVLVPSGEFTMGSDQKSDPYFWGAEGPEHTVFLDSYYIYRTEVTNAMYQECVNAKACPKPAQVFSATHADYFVNPQYSKYPVIYVSWTGALSYCQWAIAKLPTEAQWEKAARGTDGRLFPWGNDTPTSSLLSFNSRDTAEIGSFPQGVSPYGALDMAGNVLEWVNDRFQSGYYSVSPLENPIGPAGTDRRVIRGGAWHHSDISALRTVARASLKESYTGNDIGFRCVIPSP